MLENEDVQSKPGDFTRADVFIILLQILIVFGLDMPDDQIFFFTIASYFCMVLLLGWRVRKRGLSAVDRKVIVFGFIPIFVSAAVISSQIWKWKYPPWVFR